MGGTQQLEFVYGPFDGLKKAIRENVGKYVVQITESDQGRLYHVYTRAEVRLDDVSQGQVMYYTGQQWNVA